MKEGQKDFEDALRRMGYDVVDENGIVMAVVNREEYSDSRTISNIRKLATQYEYHNSFGIKMRQDGKSYE